MNRDIQELICASEDDLWAVHKAMMDILAHSQTCLVLHLATHQAGEKVILARTGMTISRATAWPIIASRNLSAGRRYHDETHRPV